jgi:hypothetical protein
MVRTIEQFTAPPTAAAIGGGFVSIPVGHLLPAWFACQGIEIGIGEFRAWLACHEMVKRRGFAPEGTQPTYGFAELATLLGVTQPRARLLVHALVTAGLLTWSESAITFPDPPPLPDDLFGPFADTIGRGKGSIAVPRPLLRFLVKGACTARIAVSLAALFRCLSCRGGLPDGWGRLKSSWIARAFRVGQRQVVAARNELVELGWLIPEGDNRQHAMNRWGRAYRIDLRWMPPTPPIARSAPPPPLQTARSAPPLLHHNPLREEIKNQNPASGGPAGVWLKDSGTQRPGSAPVVVIVTPPGPAVSITFASAGPGRAPIPASPTRSSVPVPLPNPGRPATAPTILSAVVAAPVASPVVPRPPGPGPAPAILPRPRLDDVGLEDLKDNGRLFELLGQAIERKLIGSSEADRLRFVGAAEHALAIGKGNPPGLFIRLVRSRLWRYLTQEDEDRAQARIKAFLRGPEPASLGSRPLGSPFRATISEEAARIGGLAGGVGIGEGGGPGSRPAGGMGRGPASDAEIVKAVRAAMIRAGIFRDPFPEFVKKYPEWDQERWDRAMGAMDGPSRVPGLGFGTGRWAEK